MNNKYNKINNIKIKNKNIEYKINNIKNKK